MNIRLRISFACVAVLSLAACSSGPTSSTPTAGSDPTTNSSAPATDSSTNPSSSPSEGSVPTGEPASEPVSTDAQPVIDVVNQPGTGTFDGAREDVTDVTCASNAGVWTSSGKVTNSTEAAASYRIYVSFLDAAGETLALMERDVDVLAAGASQDWSAEFTSSVEGLTCVLRVERAVSA